MASVAHVARRTAALGIALLIVGPGSARAGPTARAEHKALRLDYRLDAQGAGCPSERELRGLVAARLGFDPFDGAASTRAQLSIARRGARLRSDLKLLDASGRSLGARTIDAAAGSCAALAQSLALDLAIAVDPDLLNQPAREEPAPALPNASAAQARSQPAPAQARLEPTAPEPARAPSAEPARAPTFGVQVGILGALGLLPSAAWGLSVEGALRWALYSVALEGELFPSSTTDAAGGSFQASLARLGLRGCWHLDRFGLCLRGTAGGFHAAGQGLDDAREGWAGALSVGPVGKLEWRPGSGLTISASLALDVALIRNSVVVGDVEEWRAPPTALVANAGLGWIFP